ncbi:hypothetical protein TVAG_366060 [Trichomonas vaginalis G3]|uniref:Uncharacterized protein n=1 Tax=Trichomonas vaginalis (strain ATCC PRA-98 / G3) TaxID=412133 RepID=A2DHQ0_TRIV3|nr:hypothetical protein TVAGG3_0303110 [Trichomonas vaginalis G3]EAY20098.1 hypothetical protein TVAG_366060 [Trichomonas vaginalis G3]KAI5528051.1 hypothetical protein TVAGG3_0303110 [Trichomonas vaginalis G3]|eukprot:XP_001581084.1 hypothetical protein [Trichomonas vaginalis G3]
MIQPNIPLPNTSAIFAPLTQEELKLRKQLEEMDIEERQNAILSRLIILRQIASTITDPKPAGEPLIHYLAEQRNSLTEREIEFPNKAKSYVANVVLGLKELFFNQYSALKILLAIHASGGDIVEAIQKLIKGDIKADPNLLLTTKLHISNDALDQYLNIIHKGK